MLVGFIVSGIGTLVGSKWNFNNLMAEGGPHSHTIGPAGLIIVMADIYIITSNKAG